MTSQALGGGEFSLQLVSRQRVAPFYWRSDTHTHNAPIFGVDTLGCVNVWNKCAMQLIGYSAKEVMGHSLVQEFITNDGQALVQSVLDEALTGAETENFKFPLIT
jgi:PAS domain S-box-containing protein